MATFHVQHTPGNSPASSSTDFPQSQELFSDHEHSEHDADGDSITSQETDPSRQEDNSLFQDDLGCTPSRRKRTRANQRRLSSTLHQNGSSSDSSDYEPPPKKLSLKEIFDNHFRKKKRSSHSKKRKQPQDGPGRKPFYSISFQERQKRMFHRGIRFPFTLKKYLPLPLYLTYEQSFLGGFLNHIKRLKFQHHLQKSLKNMRVSKAREEETFETRKYTYLDDDEALSPISESGEHDETEEYDAKIVENSSFILECRIPSKKEWKIKTKKKDN